MPTVHPPESYFYADSLLAWCLLAAAGVLFLNLLYIIPEIRHVRIAPPQRVEEEEQRTGGGAHPAQPQPASPWD